VVALAAGVWVVSATAPSAQRGPIDAGLARLQADRALYGLTDPAREMTARASRLDGRGVTHTRFDQHHRGIRVFEGEAITHAASDGSVTVTSDIKPNLNVDVRARVGQKSAIATAIANVAPLGAYELRDASLWILPRGDRSVVDRLVWHVAVWVENDFEDPAAWRYFIDAHDGSVVWAFDSLETVAALGTGRTMYVGNQTVNTDSTQGTFFLRDLTRGGGNYTCDMQNRTSGTCGIFSRANNIFGNNSRTNSDRATAGADAHFGLQATWTYYQTTLARNGINGAGRRTFSRVHYGSGYENAFWSNSCFCMTYGDGRTTFFPLVSVDVAGHEMSHGVMSTEANLTYSGESGGLNESNSDIFGTLVEFFVNSSLDVPDYWIGERIRRSNYNSAGTFTQTSALRYMDDPARDGRSPACWSSGIGSLNVHYSSGPNNHMFWLLSNGGTSRCNGAVVAGIGRDRAARIWYRAVTDFMTASTNYRGARTAALNAATALYGSTSPERNAVAAAYAAINVQ
jgi:Zn-dependent metalloprotease